MTNIIACRPSCYDLPLSQALPLLRDIGVENVELRPSAEHDCRALARLAGEMGVTISSLSTGLNVDDRESVAGLERVIAGAAEIGVTVIFVAASVETSTYEEGLDALRVLASQAHAAGVVLSIETHVPFGFNGDVARRTVEAVNSPGLGFNYDSANIYYYNPKGIDTIEELKKVAPLVTSVHLKDSARGEPKSFDFPVLGQGIVDFPQVFRILGEQGFHGPYTLELEGPVVEGLPVETRTDMVKACLDYLKHIGAMP